MSINIKYVTKIEIEVFHEGLKDAEGLDEVLSNIVRKWDYPITPSIYQHIPEDVNDKIKEWVKEYGYG